MEREDEIARLVVLLIARDFESQSSLAVALSDAGFPPTRIAELTGSKTNTVESAIKRERRRRKSK